jgi:hypothetical protein
LLRLHGKTPFFDSFLKKFKLTSIMVRNLLKWGFLLLVGILIYNYLFGDSEEKAQSKKIFQQTGTVVSSAWDLLKSEKQKFDAGKYDAALDKVGGAYREIRDRAQFVDEKVLRRLDELEDRKSALEKELEGIEQEEAKATQPAATPAKKGVAKPAPAPVQSSQNTNSRKEKLMRDMDQLMSDTDLLLRQAQEN